jgi:hypothetical protein
MSRADPDALLIERIAASKDTPWLETCRQHNQKAGKQRVVEAADVRLRELRVEAALSQRPLQNTLETRVDEALRVYEELLSLRHGRRQSASYTRRELKAKGPKDAVIATIRRGKETDGLKLLAKYGRLDCAYEQIAIDFAHELPDDVVKLATQMLSDFMDREDADR